MPEIDEVLPKYLQIATHIRDKIISGALGPGATVPSGREIADDWKVARPTANKALEALRQQGFVEARRGSGTYVRDRNASPSRASERYLRAYEQGTMYADFENVEFLHVGIVTPPPDVAEALAITDGAEVIARRRLISTDEAGPTEICASWFPAALADIAPLLLEPTRLRSGTMQYVESVTGRRAASARERTRARLADSDERRHLQLTEPAAVLTFQLTVRDTHDRPLQFDDFVYPPDRWTFHQEHPLMGS